MVGISSRQPASSADGVVLKMKLSGNPAYDAIYSVEVTVGQNNQKASLSVDTGSSDLWIASRDCSDSPCSSSKAVLYDPSTSRPTGQNANLNYLRGTASGPIVWESFTLGPYTIPSQAMVAADSVDSEPLSPDFLGLLGLALPFSSRIASLIPATESDVPDGATVQQNLYGLTPVQDAPAHHFIGLTLERPNAMHAPSLLTIGKHPTEEIPDLDVTKLEFLSLIPSDNGDQYWRVFLTSITGWVDGKPKPISLGTSISTSNPNPVAILDTGGSVILATRQLANALYGAYDVSPAADGNYYLPCTTPMNLTIGLGNLPPISVHPLDLTSLPQTLTAGTNTQTCMGLIQASDQLNDLADMVLGVAFMRNVYTVLSAEDDSSPDIRFQLGLIGLTNAQQAMDEFHSIRVLGESPNSNVSRISPTDHRKVSVGIIVLIAILGFFVLCATIFGLRFWFMRKRYGKGGNEENFGDVKRQDEAELNGAPFLKSWENDGPKGHGLTDSTHGSEYTRVDEQGVIGKPDTSSTSKSSRQSFPSQNDRDHISHVDQQPSLAHSRTASANSRENFNDCNEHDTLETNDQDSRDIQQSNTAAVRTAEDDLRITPPETTVLPAPRPHFRRHAPSSSGRFNGFDIDPLFDIDFASGTVGRYPTGLGRQTERRSSSFGLDGDVSTLSQHSQRPSTGNGDRIRTTSESGRLYGHAHQYSGQDFVDSPLLANRERYS